MISYRAAIYYLPCTTTPKSNFRAQNVIPDLMCMKLQANVKSTLATNNIFHKKMNHIVYFLTYLNLYKLFLCSLEVLIQTLFFLSFVDIHVLSGLTSECCLQENNKDIILKAFYVLTFLHLCFPYGKQCNWKRYLS